ncbi:MAG: GPW/gp25 family protein [Novosphingobium sp.]
MTAPLETRLPRTAYLAFPFRFTAAGPDVAGRMEHIRQQVEQVLFTSPGERVFRPEFGFGARRHVFEPNAAPLWEVARNRLFGSLAEALKGEVDPRTLKVEVGPGPGQPEVLLVRITYTIAALQKEERHSFAL